MILPDDERVTTWKKKDGSVMEITAMTDSHLTNSINMLRRNAQTLLDAEMEFILSGPMPRGDHAQDAVDGCLRELSDMTPEQFLDEHDAYTALMREARIRDLEVYKTCTHHHKTT